MKRKQLVNNHQRMVFVVFYAGGEKPPVVVGVYEDYLEAQRKQEEKPTEYMVFIAPLYPMPELEP